MAANFEPAVAALYSRLQDQVGGIKKFARIYIDPNALQNEQQPALLLLASHYELINPNPATGPHVTKPRGRPNVWIVHLDIVVYARTPEAIDPSNLSPETQLNEILAQIEDCINWQQSVDRYDPTNQTDCNLGGIVSRCSIEGPVKFIAGAGANQGSIIVPVELLMPTS